MKITEWMGTPTGIRTVNTALIAVLGLLLIGMSIAGTIMVLEEPLIDVEHSYVFMTVYAFGGTVVFLTANGSPRFSIFMGGITFAVMNLIQQAMIIDHFGSIPTAILSTLMDFAMIISCILCLIGDTHSPYRLLGICAIHFANMFTAQMLDVIGLMDTLGETTFWWTTLACLFIILYMFLLLRPGIREDTIKSRIKKGITVIDSSYVTGPSAAISDKDVPALLGEDRSSWTPNEDLVRISEYRTAVHEDDRVSYLVTYVWDDEEKVRMTIASDTDYKPYGSGFVLVGHSFEDADGARYLRLYGEEGIFIKLLVVEGEIARESILKRFTDPIEYIKDKLTTG